MARPICRKSCPWAPSVPLPGLGHWVAENAKTTRAFLKRVDAVVPLARPLQAIQIAELPHPQKGSRAAPTPLMETLLAPALHGEDLGLISEAGLPAVADPGAALVQAAHAHKLAVVALAGPSSLMLALAASGLNGQSFAFVGYLPVDGGERASRIRELETLSRRTAQTQIVIETPYRNEVVLTGLLAALQPTTRLSVSCGLTLPHGLDAHRPGRVVEGRADGDAEGRASRVQLPGRLTYSFLAPNSAATLCLALMLGDTRGADVGAGASHAATFVALAS
jgi:16S rRNA (cytidine1402-2'-O)-methyltransferase